MWFKALTGFDEGSPQQVREGFTVERDGFGPVLVSRVTGRRIGAGMLHMPSLSDLRRRTQTAPHGPLRLREVVTDATALHRDPASAGAVIQVASQFNLLEMIAPDVSPRDGIDRYARDPTQGPACAIACGGGTLWRNYFVPVDGMTGQTEGAQLDMLSEVGTALGNRDGSLWEMRNGYALPRPGGLAKVAAELSAQTEAELDRLRGRLRVGVQRDTEVTLAGAGHRVTQVYCSALPLAYAAEPPALWEPFARLVLEAAYEAALRVGLESGAPVVLTLLGGGAFGNPEIWITDAIAAALDWIEGLRLDVTLASYRHPNPALASLLDRFG